MYYVLALLLFCFLSVLCIYLVLYLLYVFFFKQKTAYEMRISDWSSDVCSSDLALYSQTANPIVSMIAEESVRALARALPVVVREPANQIGRASCRERVCQYV